MDPCKELEAYLHDKIPLTRAMEVKVEERPDEGFALVAPLQPNINDKGTAFAGSLSALVTLAGWALLHVVLRDRGITARIAVAESTLEYREPATGTLEAACHAHMQDGIERLLQTLERKGKARIQLDGTVHSAGQLVVTFSGRYAVQVVPS